MKTILPMFRRSFLGITAIVQLLFFPVVTFAETPSAATGNNLVQTDKKQASATHLSAKPEGYTFNKQTGLWENGDFTWNPETKQTKPKSKLDYSYNPQTGRWDTKTWQYDDVAQKYVSQDRSKPNSTADEKKEPSKAPQVNNKVPGPANTKKGTFDLFYDADISNNSRTTAQSGNATIQGNTTGGNATSGNASAIANTLNLLQSSWGLQGKTIASFNADITGDVVGDLLLSPTTTPDNNLTVGAAGPATIDVNVQDKHAIQNTITVGAKSGNAGVINNTTGGNATSGDASAIANVINLVNSAITSGQSFVGNINIQGNFEGDILLPDSIKNQLLAANTPTPNNSSGQNKNTLQQLASDQHITNTINLRANSGSAAIRNNTTAGSAQTGAADTNLTVLNLTGKQVVGNNALLVFVNVMGEWVGMIVDAPAGATAGMIGGNATIQPVASQRAGVRADSKNTLRNTINVAAQSGNADVRNNTTGGNARTGKATAGASILNLSNSQFSLADWFGVLFINVLGKWHGSFGIDTPMGTIPIATPAPNTITNPAAGVKAVRISNTDSKRMASANLEDMQAILANNSLDMTHPNGRAQVLAPASGSNISFGPQNTASARGQHINYWPAAIATSVAAAILAGERIVALRHHRAKHNSRRQRRAVARRAA